MRKKKDLQLISKVGKKRIYHAWFSDPSTGHQGGWEEEIPCLPYGKKLLNNYEHIFLKKFQ
jgi:hypothetical protein